MLGWGRRSFQWLERCAEDAVNLSISRTVLFFVTILAVWNRLFGFFWGRDLFLSSIVYNYQMPEIALEKNLVESTGSGDISARPLSLWPSSAGHQPISHGLYAQHWANCIVCAVTMRSWSSLGSHYSPQFTEREIDSNRLNNGILGTKLLGGLQHPNYDTKQNRISLTMLCGSCLALLPTRNISVLLKVRSPTVWTALIVANLVKFYLPVC